MDEKTQATFNKLTENALLNNQLTTVLARNEALDIVVSILNGLISLKIFTDEQIAVIQSVVTAEGEKTKKISDSLFSKLDKELDKKYATEIVKDAISKKESEDESWVY